LAGSRNCADSRIERISGFIRQLLTLARRPEPQLRPVNINDIVRRAWEVVDNRERTDGVITFLDLADTMPPILGDLIADGRISGTGRPWLGVAADDTRGHLVVSRVTPGSAVHLPAPETSSDQVWTSEVM